MAQYKKIHTALISVFHKEGLEEIIQALQHYNIQIISTGGTYDYITNLGANAKKVEDVTGYPSLLHGRVKTLHPQIFGGILYQRDNTSDKKDSERYGLPEIDMVIVDLYPFEQTVNEGASEEAIVEKIDIGGISLIRAAAKNFRDILVVSSRNQYQEIADLIMQNEGGTHLEERRHFAAEAFAQSSHYDTAIFNSFKADTSSENFRLSKYGGRVLRYGENPHQRSTFYGNFEEYFHQLHGKSISYNNLLDIDAAVNLIDEFKETTFAIIKHNNACGVASRQDLTQAWQDALAGDPVSAFGGILVTNSKLDETTAREINKLFFEVIIAPDYEDKALDILKSKKNRIILLQKKPLKEKQQLRSALDGVLVQDKDTTQENTGDLQTVTDRGPSVSEKEDMVFGNIIVKHSKSNAIVLAKNKQLIASGIGQTSRIDALKQAIEKANHFNLELNQAVMASDAFFPFADSVEIANKAGIRSVVQPGGSKRDQESIDYCNAHGMAMVFTETRHFKH